jgi:hypothetical protein
MVSGAYPLRRFGSYQRAFVEDDITHCLRNTIGWLAVSRIHSFACCAFSAMRINSSLVSLRCCRFAMSSPRLSRSFFSSLQVLSLVFKTPLPCLVTTTSSRGTLSTRHCTSRSHCTCRYSQAAGPSDPEGWKLLRKHSFGGMACCYDSRGVHRTFVMVVPALASFIFASRRVTNVQSDPPFSNFKGT